MLDILRDNFQTLTDVLHSDPVQADQVFENIIARYNEPQRHYHTTTHLVDIFSVLA